MKPSTAIEPRTPGALGLGLYGGSFDPVHRGHLHVAQAAQDACGLQEVLFVPAARPPHKLDSRLVSGAHRLAMLAIATAERADWSVLDLELERTGPSYSIDTVRAVIAARGGAPAVDLHLLLGSDNLAGLPGWLEVEELLTLARPIIVLRAGDSQELPPAVVAALPARLIERLEHGFLRPPPAPGRSSDLRRELQTQDARELPHLPAGVGEYIAEHGLYRRPV